MCHGWKAVRGFGADHHPGMAALSDLPQANGRFPNQGSISFPASEPPREQEQVLEELRRGEIDIVVGTHRLVQKDVKFKDLGLCIIDEEQRFGVKHKESFKEMRNNVDVLTLSATPIPRTLNMAMSGIRDMSTIEEAPQDRQPVQTYVMEHDWGILTQAMNKELRRGGQVFYLHNRVDTIDRCAATIQQFLPDATVVVAHGKMSEEQLSKVWKRLIDHEIDILVCTTIIGKPVWTYQTAIR